MLLTPHTSLSRPVRPSRFTHDNTAGSPLLACASSHRSSPSTQVRQQLYRCSTSYLVRRLSPLTCFTTLCRDTKVGRQGSREDILLHGCSLRNPLTVVCSPIWLASMPLVVHARMRKLSHSRRGSRVTPARGHAGAACQGPYTRLSSGLRGSTAKGIGLPVSK